ncbi:trypsin-like peptidase domain-containing protein [Streptosporangium sp. CA-135522]|uniref:trypsin-like peptidase domain-containing protein n=1 Tax=Streptosporangium sp. CA-135522 TaxID=3240072 RepID=UPI003D8CD43B
MTEDRARLEAAFRSVCVSLETTNGDSVGSGFFVGPGQVLTCAHVVAARGQAPPSHLLGRWEGRELLLEVLGACWLPAPDGPDLALLRVTPPPNELSAALSASVLPGDELWTFGFPQGPYRPGDSVSFRYDGPSLREDGARLLRITHGRAVEGFSGAPVLNWRTGGVCGVLRLADSPAGGPPGARLIPAEVINRVCREELAQDADTGWLSLLDDARLHAGGWRRLGPRLRAYLKVAREESRQHPYATALPGAPRLDAVYVHQQAARQSESPQGPAAPEISGTAQGRRPAHQQHRGTAPAEGYQFLQRFDADDILERHHGGLIVGGPGAGKSSLLKHFLQTAADRWLETGSGEYVPVLVRAHALAGDLPLPQAVAAGVQADLGSRLEDAHLAEDLTREAASGTPWLILLDGVDEILDPAARARVLRAVVRWWPDERYRFLITSRPLPHAELDELRKKIPIFDIQPFSEEQLPVLAERWFTALGLREVDSLIEEFVEQLFQKHLGQLARTPLISTMICVVFAHEPGRQLPHSRAELYERFVGVLLDKSFTHVNAMDLLKRRAAPYGTDAVRAVESLQGDLGTHLETLAVRIFSAVDTSGDVLEHARAATSAIRPANLPEEIWRDFVAESLRQSGLILEKGGGFEFVHHTIAEYLAARWSAWRSGRFGFRDRWRIAVGAGRQQSLDLFVAALLQQGGVDLTRPVPRLLMWRRLVHARLVAALVRDGVHLPEDMVQTAKDRLTEIIERRSVALPAVLRERFWDYEDDCVLAAISLSLIDQQNGLRLLTRLAADPRVGGFHVPDVGAYMTDLLNIAPGEDLALLSRLAADDSQESYYRAAMAEFVLDKDPRLGTPLSRELCADPTMDSNDRLQCAENLVEADHQAGIDAFSGLVADPSMREDDRQSAADRLLELASERGVAALSPLIADPNVDPAQRSAYIARLLHENAAIPLDALSAFVLDPSVAITVRFDRLRLIRKMDSARADSLLAETVANGSDSGLHRSLACAVLLRQSPADGARVVETLSGDSRAPGFHRVFCHIWLDSTGEAAAGLTRLAADGGLGGEWRLLAAEMLIDYDGEAGEAVLRELSLDSAMPLRLRWRCRITLLYRTLRKRLASLPAGAAGSG